MSSSKRKSDASAPTGATKKSRTSASEDHSSARAYIEEILGSPDGFELPEDDGGIRKRFVEVARYAKSLEAAKPATPAPKSRDQINEAVEKLRKTARNGIRKQMTVRSKCFPFDNSCNLTV